MPVWVNVAVALLPVLVPLLLLKVTPEGPLTDQVYLVMLPPGLGSLAETFRLAVVPAEESTALAAWVTVGGWAWVTVVVPVTPLAVAWTVSVPNPDAGAVYTPVLALIVPAAPVARDQEKVGCVARALPN